MKAKILILMFLTLLVLVIFFKNYWPTDQIDIHNSPSKNDILKSKSITNTESIIDPDTDTKTSEKATTKQKKLLTEQQLFLQEIENRIFSDDAYVEIFSLEMLLGFCGEASMLEDFITSGQSYISSQQQKTITSYKEQCKTYQIQYPNLIEKKRKERLAELQPQSHLGLLLERRKNISKLSRQERDELEAETLIEAIREQNSAVAIEVSFSHRFDQSIALQLTDLLNSKDLTYIGQISQLAVVNLACEYQGGMACESSSALMMLVCSQQPESCGLDFPTWYQQNTLPGMKNDVETLKAYYQNKAQ